ncbi:hypothetical protein Pst134EA_015509 [Puccinia striiformis f. sp. tritici]|uniref:hypothetical protein n=1 Tax=Puccinia striiformis f. sp. tritici TaxID=168172 RepID=UPI0020087AB6|nr:hypothetical protein Pst134EA_015509 [Puccinia striiformis f. sp. tritici]KAH9463425.1 hypothetical protein Pst134EA_015509 [Puccinia striiformis f. sp. tritici]
MISIYFLAFVVGFVQLEVGGAATSIAGTSHSHLGQRDILAVAVLSSVPTDDQAVAEGSSSNKTRELVLPTTASPKRRVRRDAKGKGKTAAVVAPLDPPPQLRQTRRSQLPAMVAIEIDSTLPSASKGDQLDGSALVSVNRRDFPAPIAGLLNSQAQKQGANVTFIQTKRDLPPQVAALLNQGQKNTTATPLTKHQARPPPQVAALLNQGQKNTTATPLTKRDFPAPIAGLLNSQAQKQGANVTFIQTKRDLPPQVAALLNQGQKNTTATPLTKRDFPAPIAGLLNSQAQKQGANVTFIQTKRDLPPQVAALLNQGQKNTTATPLTKRDFPAPIAGLLNSQAQKQGANVTFIQTKRDLPLKSPHQARPPPQVAALLNQGQKNTTATPLTKRDFPAPIAGLLNSQAQKQGANVTFIQTKRDLPPQVAALLSQGQKTNTTASTTTAPALPARRSLVL